MKNLYLILAIIASAVLTGCNSTPEDLSVLEGYWEIEKAETPEGDTRTYKINTAIDHYQLETDSSGFKSRVSPLLDGTFLTTGNKEAFQVKREESGLKLYFSTPYGAHTETVTLLKDQQLIMTNEAGLRYTYKRYKKLELE